MKLGGISTVQLYEGYSNSPQKRGGIEIFGKKRIILETVVLGPTVSKSFSFFHQTPIFSLNFWEISLHRSFSLQYVFCRNLRTEAKGNLREDK